MPSTTKRFSAVVHKLGINPCVDVPHNLAIELLRSAGRRAGPIPIQGKVNRTPVTATVVKYRGVWRLYLNTEMRRRAGVEPEDVVAVSIRFDPAPRLLKVPTALRAALSKNKAARARWEQLAPSHRRQYLAYLGSLKRKESVDRNVRKTIRSLLTG
jgi:hypothetical protein